jgi:hypothetical protein
MTSRKLNYDNLNNQFVALYTNSMGQVIEKRFCKKRHDLVFQDIIRYWSEVDIIQIKERFNNISIQSKH